METYCLTVGELPKFTPQASTNNVNIGGYHDAYYWQDYGGVFSVKQTNSSNASNAGDAKFGTVTLNSNHTHTVTINEIGGDIAHNNIAPYKAAHIWIRTA